MKYAPYYRAEVSEGYVRRCENTGTLVESAAQADAQGKADGRPYVVADEAGLVVEIPA